MDIPYTTTPRPDTGLYNAKVGIWLFLASEVMLFGAFFSAYILLRVSAGPGEWPHGLLNVPLGTLNTIILITSSITEVMAWASLKQNKFGNFKKYQACTLLLAVIFLCIKSSEYVDKFNHYDVELTNGQVVDGHMLKSKGTADEIVLHGHYVNKEEELHVTHGWQARELEAREDKEISIRKSDIKSMENYSPRHSTFTAVYFTLTGLHALHILGGIIVMAYLWGPGSKMWKTDPERFTNRNEIAGLFWHFVDLVWIFLFPVLYLL
jgi:cytochrome c oxidase subunit 3